MRIRTTRSLPVCLLALITAVFFGQSAFGWQDEDGRVGLSHGRVDLSPAEDAENQDADGGAKLLQIGERSAIHVNVSGLEPGATYDVTVSSDDDGDSIGSITTRDGGVSPSRCYTGRLASPEEPEVIADEPAGDGGEGDGAGEDADDGMDDEGDDEGDDDGRGRPDRDRGRNNDRHWGNDRGRSHGWNFWRPSRRASGSATIMLNRDYSEASYRVSVRRLEGEVSGIRIILSDDSVIESEDLRGTFELAEGQLAAMTGGATVEVYTSGEDDEPGLALVGGVSSCFPFLDRMRAMDSGQGLGRPTRRAVAASSALAILRTPARGARAYLEGGRVLARVWAAATEAGLAFQPLSALLYLFERLADGGEGLDVAQREHLTRIATEFEAVFGTHVGTDLLLFRLAPAPGEPTSRSPRKDVDEVLEILG